MGVFKWEEPPARRYGAAASSKKPRPWSAEVRKLRSRPKEWALIAVKPTENSAYQFSYSVKRGTTQAFLPAGSFEAKSAGRKVYVRYVGEQPQDGAA